MGVSEELTEVPGTGMEVSELTEVPGTVAQAYITHRSSGYDKGRLYPYPGYCCTGVQNSQKIQVRV